MGLLDGRYRLGELPTSPSASVSRSSRWTGLVATARRGRAAAAGTSVGTEALTLRLVGLGPAGTRIGDQLLRAGVGRVVVVDPDSSTPWAGWAHGRDRVQVADHWSAPSTGPVDLTIVVATCLETDRAVTTELTQAGHPHLLVRPRARGAVVGPLVLPGRTSCVACADLARTRTDPAWPRMLAQLCRTRGEWDPLAADWAAASVTTQALSHLAGRTVETRIGHRGARASCVVLAATRLVGRSGLRVLLVPARRMVTIGPDATRSSRPQECPIR